MLIDELLKLPRPAKRLILAATDCLFVMFALWLSFSLRLGEFFMAQGIYANFHYLFLLAPALAMVIFPFFGLYRTIIRYIGILAIWSIIKAVTIYSLAFGVVVLLIGFPGIPRSVILINWLAAIILVGGSRIIGRWWLTGNLGLAAGSKHRTRVAVYGAGGAGIQIATALQSSPGFKPVAFIDDNRSLQGNYIEGLPVHPLKRLNDLIEDLGITEVLMAMPSVARSRRSEIISQLEPFPVHVSTLPGLDDLASGRVKVDDIREVDISDLLGRDTVKPDLDLLHANIKDKVVLVSGAGGSIGSELCRQIIKIGPQKLILYERGSTGRQHVMDAFSQRSLSPRVEMEATNTDIIVRMVEADFGVSVVPLFADGMVTRGRLVSSQGLGKQIRPIDSGILTRKHESLSSGARAFVRFVRDNVID